ncbi:MAG TPA: hypothetical protein VF992_08810 [Thermoplasmata archaeon]
MTYAALWTIFFILLAAVVIIPTGSLLTGHLNEQAAVPITFFSVLSLLTYLGIRRYRVTRFLLVGNMGIRLFGGSVPIRNLSWTRVRKVRFNRESVENQSGLVLRILARPPTRRISINNVYYTIPESDFLEAADAILRMARERGIPTDRRLEGKRARTDVSLGEAATSPAETSAQREERRKLYHEMARREMRGQPRAARAVLPLSWAQRRGIRSFRQIFGPRNPGYFVAAVLFLFFALFSLIVPGLWSTPDPVRIVFYGYLVTALALWIVWEDVPKTPHQFEQMRRFGNRGFRILGMAALVLVLVGGAAWGTTGYLAAGAAMFAGFAAGCLWGFLVCRIDECSYCGGLTPFRREADKWVCTRCGQAR